VAGWLEQRQLAICLPLPLEARYSARASADYQEMMDEFDLAACAHEAGAGVLHYDRDYDVIAEHTSLGFESIWLAPAGTL